MANPIFPDGFYVFTVHGGQEIRDGKPRWPAHINVVMDRLQALDAIQSLATHLRQQDETEIGLNFAGSIERLDDDKST